MRRNAHVLAGALVEARRGDVRAIHRVRVASRRLRAALQIAQTVIGGRASDAAAEVRRVAKALGPVREMDVVQALIEGITVRDAWTPIARRRVERYCEAERDRRLATAVWKLTTVRGADLERDVRSGAADVDRGAPGRITVTIVSILRQRARRLSEAFHAAGVVYAHEPLHDVRLAAKKLRYACESGGALTGPAGRRAVQRLRRLQEHLGDMHDAQMVQHVLRAVSALPDTGRRLADQLTTADARLEEDCRRQHARVLAARPGVAEAVDQAVNAAAHRVSPRHVGRMARMPGDRGRAGRARAAR
jgi:CHAD domain-containing protein